MTKNKSRWFFILACGFILFFFILIFASPVKDFFVAALSRTSLIVSGDFATCSTNLDCGVDGLIGSVFCQNNNVYQNYDTYTCNNPGTDLSSCEKLTTAQLQTTCKANETCSNGVCVNALVPIVSSSTGGTSYYYLLNKYIDALRQFVVSQFGVKPQIAIKPTTNPPTNLQPTNPPPKEKVIENKVGTSTKTIQERIIELYQKIIKALTSLFNLFFKNSQ